MILLQCCNYLREQSKFTTTVYRKPTFSGVYSNFESFLLSVYKFGMVYTVVYRCFHIFTELTFLKGIFSKNGYPENLIDKCFKKFLNIHLVKENVIIVRKKKNKKKNVCSQSFHTQEYFLYKLGLNCNIREEITQSHHVKRKKKLICQINILFQ